MIEIEDKITDNTCNGNCSKCGQCCGNFIPVTKQEVYIIKKYVKKHNIKQEKRVFGKNVNLRCPFFNKKEHKCNIYEVRPFVCQDFICSRKDWRKYRDKYEQRADYNGSLKSVYSMDELIYDDLSFFVLFVSGISKDRNGDVDYEIFMRHLRNLNRLDILKYLEFEFKEEK